MKAKRQWEEVKVEGRGRGERGVGIAVGWKDMTDKWESGIRGIRRDGRVKLRRERRNDSG